jgi:hypothetical protein
MARHGLAVTQFDDSEIVAKVVLDSQHVRVEVIHDFRGEIDVSVYPHGPGSYGRWRYGGMVGRASLLQLLEMAAGAMESDPAVLRGDAVFYEARAHEQRAESISWTEYYARSGPRPPRPPLP